MKQLTQTTRVCRRFGTPMLQTLNEVYGYWATARFLSEDEYKAEMRKAEYVGPLHPADVAFRANAHLC